MDLIGAAPPSGGPTREQSSSRDWPDCRLWAAWRRSERAEWEQAHSNGLKYFGVRLSALLWYATLRVPSPRGPTGNGPQACLVLRKRIMRSLAVGEPTLKNIKVVATRLTLEKWEEMPVWKVRLWAAKLRDPKKDADIGQVFIAAADGKVVKNELHIERVD